LFAYEILTRAFITYVRPILEYNLPSGPPHITDITALEQVQRRFTKRLRGLRKLTYTQRLQKVGLCTLESRRLMIDLVICYKIVFGLTCLKCEEFFTPSSVNTTRGHPYKLYVSFSSVNARKCFFSNWVIEPWNNLNPGVVDFSSSKRFKSTIKKIDFSPYLKYSCVSPTRLIIPCTDNVLIR